MVDVLVFLVVFVYGNNEYIDDFRLFMVFYYWMGVHVLMGEYWGYGCSMGLLLECGIVVDFEGFLTMVLK